MAHGNGPGLQGHPPTTAGSRSAGEDAPALRLSVVVPTRNEAENLCPLKQELEAALARVSHEVIVVDDSTDDETRPLLRELASVTDCWRLIERRPEQRTGLATAVIEGMEVARGNAVSVMDADIQHPRALVHQGLAVVEDGTDLAIASRYGRGGRSDGLAGVYRQPDQRLLTAAGAPVLRGIPAYGRPAFRLLLYTEVRPGGPGAAARRLQAPARAAGALS